MTAGCAGPLRGPRRLCLLPLLLLVACGGDPSAVLPACRDAAALPVATPVEASLSATDPRLRGAFVDYYALLVEDSADLTLEMTSAAVNPFVHLFDEGGTVIAQGFAPAPPADSQATASLSYAVRRGCYLVGASSWYARETGAYQLRADLD